MEKTLFLDELQGNITVSFLALEFFSMQVMEDTSDEGRFAALEATLIKCCGIKDPQKAHFEYLLSRLQEVNEARQPLSAKPKLNRKSFWTGMHDFLNELNIVELLFLMTDFNLPLVRQLYCNTDYRHVRRLINVYVTHQRELSSVQFEAVLYGQGNKYKSDSGSNAIDAESKEGRARLASFGFGFMDIPGAVDSDGFIVKPT